MDKVIAYIIDPSEPFKGYCQNIVLENELGVKMIPYTDLSYSEYFRLRPNLITITTEQYQQKLNKLLNEYRKEQSEITKDRYWEMLEILPPCRWFQGRTVEYFHVSERLLENLVSWFAQVDDRYFEFTDSDSIPHTQLLNRIYAIAGV